MVKLKEQNINNRHTDFLPKLTFISLQKMNTPSINKKIFTQSIDKLTIIQSINK